MYHYAEAIGNVLGLEVIGTTGDLFMDFAVGNFDGTEDLRTVLNAIAEATQTIYFINHLNQLEFKQLNRDGLSVYTITKEDYINLHTGENKRLQTICHVTELGDNVEAHTSLIGSTQYVRNNPFWDNTTDKYKRFVLHEFFMSLSKKMSPLFETLIDNIIKLPN